MLQLIKITNNPLQVTEEEGFFARTKTLGIKWALLVLASVVEGDLFQEFTPKCLLIWIGYTKLYLVICKDF